LARPTNNGGQGEERDSPPWLGTTIHAAGYVVNRVDLHRERREQERGSGRPKMSRAAGSPSSKVAPITTKEWTTVVDREKKKKARSAPQPETREPGAELSSGATQLAERGSRMSRGQNGPDAAGGSTPQRPPVARDDPASGQNWPGRSRRRRDRRPRIKIPADGGGTESV